MFNGNGKKIGVGVIAAAGAIILASAVTRIVEAALSTKVDRVEFTTHTEQPWHTGSEIKMQALEANIQDIKDDLRAIRRHLDGDKEALD